MVNLIKAFPKFKFKFVNFLHKSRKLQSKSLVFTYIYVQKIILYWKIVDLDIFFHEFNFFYASAENNQNWNFIYFKFSGNIKESYLVNPSPPSTLQKAKRRKWFREKYSSKNNKNYKNQDVGIPYPFRKPKKHTQTGTGTKPETEAKIKSSFGSQKITHSELKFRKMSIFVEQKRIFF